LVANQDKYFNILRVPQHFRSTTRNQQRNKTKQTIFSRNCKQTTSAIANKPLPQLQNKPLPHPQKKTSQINYG